MGYVIKAPLGLAMFIGGIVLANVKLVALLETGTCASGNTPYQIAQPCPSGTGTDILLLMAGILGGVIGIGLFAYRGDPPWDKNRPINLDSDFSFPAFAWGVAFTATGATSLIAGLTNEAVKNASGAELGALIVGGTFLLMGLPVLAASLWWALKDFRNRNQPHRTAPPAGGSGGGAARLTSPLSSSRQWTSAPSWAQAGFSSTGGGTGGQIAKLERLQKLRESGALTDIEFEREKAKILSEG